MKYGAIISARMTSSRLPGKPMMNIAGKALIERVVERVKKSKLINGIVIATTVNKEDLPIVALAEKLGIGVYRGSEKDVLLRVSLAAKEHGVEKIVRITGDCPLIDFNIIDQVIMRYEETKADYTCNDSHIPSFCHPSYPRGLDVEVFSAKLLDEVSKITADPFHREHVTLYIYENPQKYKITVITAKSDECYPELRTCVDEEADLRFVRKVYEELYPANPNFLTRDIIDLAKKNPEIASINTVVRQKGIREK
ncbi:MAG: glycosyltransferase family protein [Candidatus Omnitrophica bacterium]|nr:glycosyltransferase family protein [Candidatus Omnitrophota bacterium]